MKLKKLTVVGFKSFAEKIALDFDCSIVCIVGPNGCGKSNIVDAFRWVTGEQSAKSLRGDKMHDVLFAGTDKLKPLNYAEVSLTFTDINGQLPIPYEELTITRRLHRNGDSEYLINKELVRLKDIQGLFLGSGIGKNAFSIFEQGKLDQIIHLSPLERRIIFDEAAGTSRFLLRKKETVRKLMTVTENFTRVKDIHGEIEKQTKQLRKQASHAKTYQENVKKLEEIEKSVLLYRWQSSQQKNQTLNNQHSHLLSTIKQNQAALHALEQVYTQAKQDLALAELAAKQSQKELNLSETKLRVQESELNQQKHHVLEVKKREENLKAQLSILAEEQKTSSIEIKKKEELLGTFTPGENLKDLIKGGRDDHLKKVQEAARIDSDVQKRVFRYETQLNRLQALVDFEKKHQQTNKGHQELIHTQQEKVTKLTQQIDAFKEEIDRFEKELQLLRKHSADAQKEEQVILRQLNEKEGHLKSLQRLQEEMEGFSLGAKALLKEAKNASSPLYQKLEPLFEYLSPYKGFEQLLASSMKAYSETLVLETDEVFNEVLAFAKKKKISDFSLVVKKHIDPKNSREGTVSHFIQPNLVSTHFTVGFEIAEEGHFYDSLGVFFHVGSGKKLNNTFYRQAELKSLTTDLLDLQQQIQALALKREHLAEKLKSAEKKRNEAADVRRKKEMDLVKENFMLQRAISDHEKLQADIASLVKEKEGLNNLEEEEKIIEESRRCLHMLKNEAADLLERLRDQEILFEKWQEIHQQILIIKAKQQQSSVHEKKMLAETEELGLRAEATLKKIVYEEQEIQTASMTLKLLQQDVKEKERKLIDFKKGCELNEKELVHNRKQLSQLEKELHALEIVLAQDMAERKSIESELEKRFSLHETLTAEPRVILEGGLEEATKDMHRLRLALEDAGAINMTAIAEFQETQARFDYLDQQLKDLEESKKDLEEIIAKLDQESRKIFKKTFQQIRENFQKNFAILFNGGLADLTFTESSDILEAGIEIIAKPPGKQMRSISLLSGGEKCLTALALLFSIFEVKPAPFCILDEVDAPLDDSNIERFTNILKQFIEKTQFIIVTHNKKTMAIADLLIGVSMEEKGVSKLISLSFEKKPTAALL